MEEILGNGLRLRMGEESFPLGTDSVLLASFADLPKNARVADLGSGCGTLGLLLCARREDCSVCGVELSKEAHEQAIKNIEENRLSHRMKSHLADVRSIGAVFPAGSFDCVISNPPYFPVGSGKVSEKHAAFRSEESLCLKELCAAAAWLLPSSGRFFLVHRPERLCDVVFELRQAALEPKRLQFVRHRPNAPYCLMLIEARRGGKPGLKYEPDLIEFDESGKATKAYLAAYHTGGSL